MNQSSTRLCAMAMTLLLLTLPCPAQTAKDQIRSETERLKQMLPSLGLSEDESKQYEQELSQAEAALGGGYVYFGLYKAGRMWTLLRPLAYSKSKAEIEKHGVEAFEKEWRRLAGELAQKEKRLLAKPQLAAAAVALMDYSITQVRPYHQSGRLYGLNTTIGNGLYYLGQARANLDFALFCQGLGLKAAGGTIKLRSMDAELAALEAEIVKAFDRPEAAPNQRAYIVAHSVLKISLDLNREKRLAGALHAYLETCRAFYGITATEVDEKEIPGMKSQLDSFRSRFSSGGRDHSIGLIQWERVRFALDRAAEGNIDKDELKRAAVILRHVLPRYFKFMERSLM